MTLHVSFHYNVITVKLHQEQPKKTIKNNVSNKASQHKFMNFLFSLAFIKCQAVLKLFGPHICKYIHTLLFNYTYCGQLDIEMY